MNVLFLCNQNENCSRSAEEYFRQRFNTASAGLFNESPVTKAHLEWADTVAVMEDCNRSMIAERFPDMYLQKRIINLDIPDIFQRDQPELLKMLRDKSDMF